jgi:hypothetical protein
MLNKLSLAKLCNFSLSAGLMQIYVTLKFSSLPSALIQIERETVLLLLAAPRDGELLIKKGFCCESLIEQPLGLVLTGLQTQISRLKPPPLKVVP